MINCAKGLRKLLPSAEKYGVTIIMELLNSYGHKDYQCDKTSWGSALCEMVGSQRFKLLLWYFTICRSWKEISLIQLQNTIRTSAIFTQEAYPEKRTWMRRRNYIIGYSWRALVKQDIKVSLVRNLFRLRKINWSPCVNASRYATYRIRVRFIAIHRLPDPQNL